MIISFRGTDVTRNNAEAAIALYAGMNAIKYNRKTFVLQFMTLFPTEDAMNGRARKEQQFGEERAYNDTGMDALLLRASRQKISEDIIQATCESMLSQSGLLTVASVSKLNNDEFGRDCLAQQDDILALIARLQDIYDDIFMLLDGKNHELLDVLSAPVDDEFICVPQGNNEPYYTSAKKSTIMVMDFDRESAYNAKHMSKLYGVKNVALCPYNVFFKDAFNTSSILNFVIKNSKPSAYDSNSFFIECIFDVYKVVIGQNVLESEDMYFPHMEEKYNRYDEYDEPEPTEKVTLTHKNIVYDDEQRGFFGKLFGKKKSNFEIVTDNGEIEKDEELVSREQAEKEGYAEEYPKESYVAEEDDEDFEDEYEEMSDENAIDYQDDDDDDDEADDEIEYIEEEDPDDEESILLVEEEDDEEGWGNDGLDYSQMKPKELYDECMNRGIKVPKKKNASFYIKKLEEDDEEESWED